MLERDRGFDLARQGWDEPYRTSFVEYVSLQSAKESAVPAVHDAVGRLDDYRQLPAAWINALKLHGAVLPLAEFAATVGNECQVDGCHLPASPSRAEEIVDGRLLPRVAVHLAAMGVSMPAATKAVP